MARSSRIELALVWDFLEGRFGFFSCMAWEAELLSASMLGFKSAAADAAQAPFREEAWFEIAAIFSAGADAKAGWLEGLSKALEASARQDAVSRFGAAFARFCA